MLTIQKTVPTLDVPLLDGGRFNLREQKPDLFTMVVFYRGLHCPVCKTYLKTLQEHIDRYQQLGVTTVAVSCDPRERAQKARDEWGVDKLTIGHDLSIDGAREWGLYISTAIKDGEPAEFAEPGLFLVNPDSMLYYAAVNSMPFGRPDVAEFHKRITFIKDEGYPSRGRA